MPELIKKNIYVKGKTLDVLVETDSEEINIEVNSYSNKVLRRRNASYIFNRYANNVEVGSSYLKMPKFIQVNLTSETDSDIPDVATFAKLSGDNTFTGTNTFAYNSIKINNKYHGTNGASWATTIQGWDPTGGGNNNFILTLPKTSGTITVGVKVNGTIHAADSSGLVDLGTISGGSSGPIKTATLSGTTLSVTLS